MLAEGSNSSGMNMKSRERVKLILKHKEADRVPLDIWGSASRLDTEFYLKLIKYFGFKKRGERIRPGMATEYVDYRVSDKIGSDFRHINIKKPERYESYVDKNGNIIDEWGVGRKLVGKYPSITFSPLANSVTTELKNHKWPIPEDPGRIKGIEEEASAWFKNTSYSISTTAATSGLFFDIACFLRGTENFLMDMHLNPLFTEALIEKISEIIIRINLYYIKPISKYIEWIEFTSDHGMQTGPFFSRKFFKKYFKKHFIDLFTSIKKEAPNIKVFLHTCGSIKELIPEFIDTGLDILNPVQPLAVDMDSFELKKEFGKDLVFHGGIDIQKAMIGTIKDVREEVKKRMEALAPNGGYICAPTNHIQPDVPIENFIALYEYAKEYGRYSLES